VHCECVAVLHRVTARSGALRCVAVCCSVLQCVAVCCSVLQCVAVRCSVMQPASSAAVRNSSSTLRTSFLSTACCSVLQYLAMCRTLLQCVAVCCGVLQCVAVCCSMLLSARRVVCCSVLQCVALCYSVLQCVAMCCSVLLPWVATFVVSSSMQRLPHAPSLPLFISKVRLFNDRLFPLFQLPRLQCCHTIHEHLCTY